MPDENKGEPLPKGPTDSQIEAKRELLLAEKYGGDIRKMWMQSYKDGVILKRKYDELVERTVPKDHVVIPKADADALAAYRKIGEPTAIETSLAALGEYQALGEPKVVKEAVEELPKVRGTLAQRDRDAELGRLADARGYIPAVLKRPGVADGMTFVLATLTDDKGVETESIEVKDLDPAGKPRTRKIEDVEGSDWKDLMPALKPGKPGRTDGADRAVTRRELPIGVGGYHGEDRPGRTSPDRDQDSGQRVAARRIGYGRM